MAPDLHALINQPGAGLAAKALKDAGFWKEDVSDLPRWIVTAQLTVTVDRCFDVAAPSAETARKAIVDNDDWDEDGDVDDVTVLSVQSDPNPVCDPFFTWGA